jgi:hypothetical protein
MNTQKAKRWFLLWMILIITFGLLLSVTPSNALVTTWEMVEEYTGAIVPEGSPPWLKVIIDDNDASGNVTLTLISNLIDSEFVNLWLFNYDTDNFTLAPSDFVFQPSSTGPEPIILIADNAYHAPQKQLFDIQLDFENATSIDRFGPFEEVVFTITKLNLTAHSFNSSSHSDTYRSGFFTAAHIGGIGPTGDDSGWLIHNPEPSTVLLVFFGLMGFIGLKKKARN